MAKKKTRKKAAPKEPVSTVVIYTNAPESYDQHHSKGEATAVKPWRKVTVSAESDGEVEAWAKYQADRYESGMYKVLTESEWGVVQVGKRGAA